MADLPSLDPSVLIAESGADLTRHLAEIARQAVADALANGKPATVAEVVAALEAITASLGQGLADAIADALPEIAEQAITAAEASIADAREQSGKGFPEVTPPEPGDFSGWSATVAAGIVAALVKVAKDAPTPQAATAAVLDAANSDLSGHIAGMADTASARTVNDSREATFKANSDIVKKLHYTAVRDEKTSQGCRHLDGVDFNIWANNIPRPPLHNGCRSFLRPITGIKRKKGATQKEIDRQNWAIFRRLEREAKAAEGRALEHLETRLAPAIGDLGVFSGYALTWNTLDRHGTAFAPGAFAASLIEHRSAGTAPVMLWAHDPASPIGTWLSITEDHKGLRVEGKLVTETRQGGEAYALLKAGSLNGLSIGFRRLADRARQGGGRLITAASLQEISLVTIPSNETARITEVRGAPAVPDAAPLHLGDSNHMTAKTAAASDETGTETTTKTRSAGALDARLGELSNAIAEHRARLDRVEARAARAGIAGAETRNDAAEIETRAFAVFIRRGRESLAADEIRSLRVSDDTAGGYLAPDQFVAELLRNVVQFSPIRSVARVASTSSGAVILPRRTGRLTASWVGETSDRPDTAPAYGQARFTVHELSCFVDVSNQMLEDSALDIASELSFDFAEEFGRAEGAAFVNGSGNLQPSGLLNDSSIASTPSGEAAVITGEGFVNIYHALAPAYRQNAVWLMNSATLAKVRALVDPTTKLPLMLPTSAGLVAEPNVMLLGRPIIEAPDMPDIGAGAFPVLFGDFNAGFRIFDRVALSVLRDPYSQATNGLTRFHARRRLAAGVAKSEAIRKLKISAS
jgi:HK97 family phage major capsid protein/HK97 family phage prohead protease